MSTIWIAIIVFSLLGLVSGLILSFAAYRFQTKEDPLANTIDSLLPQSQCGQCGYPGCRPYADAVANNGEAINKCVPGGEAVMLKIAETLGVEPQPMDEEVTENANIRTVAFIDEDNCIGCTKCIQACPVDAIIGTNKALHTVVADLCTGCELCIPPCPTDCIIMIPIQPTTSTWKWQLNSIPVKMVPSVLLAKPVITSSVLNSGENHE